MIDLSKIVDFETRFKESGFSYYTDPDHVNLIGWRDSSANSDQFSDLISVHWISDLSPTGWSECHWQATTRPGLPYLLKPLNPKGCALLVPGQYPNAYVLGAFKGSYKALLQVGPVSVYRVNSKDGKLTNEDSSRVQVGDFGIDIHKAGLFSKLIGNWSAGCQVFSRSTDFQEFIQICEEFFRRGQHRFTYTLFEV